MCNDLFQIIKEWSGFGQFLFLFFIAAFALSFSAMIVHTIGKFFIKTLPVLLRGWPPTKSGATVFEDDND